MFFVANVCLPKITGRFILEMKTTKNGMCNHIPFAETMQLIESHLEEGAEWIVKNLKPI